MPKTESDTVRIEATSDAPLIVMLEAWPSVPRARASITQNGKTRDLEISSFALQMILGAVRSSK